MGVGRPTVVTPGVLQKLEQAFLMGCSDPEACLYADISERTLYNYQGKNPEFVQRKDKLRKNPVMKARQAMLDLIESEDEAMKYKAATDTLNRYDGKPIDRHEVTGKDGEAIENKWTVEVKRPKDIDADDTDT